MWNKLKATPMINSKKLRLKNRRKLIKLNKLSIN